MFDSVSLDRLASAADELCAVPADELPEAVLAEQVRHVQAQLDRLECRQLELLARVEATSAYEADGAPTAVSWARRELRLDVRAAKARFAAASALSLLPQVAAAAASGEIRGDHVQEFAAGIKKLGAEVIADAQAWLVPVAATCEPAELRATIAKLDEVIRPDRLDQAWVDGMAKRDVQLAKCGDGFALTGFLDIVTGTVMKTWMDAAAAPTSADDMRAPWRRRLDALNALVSSALESGLPPDRGVRPQLHILVEADRLRGEPGAPPATLSGYGPIGEELLGYLRCLSDVTPVAVDGLTDGPTAQAKVLNVGRKRRLATRAQRIAVRARQDGHCANPGCANTHLELHHVAWWDRDTGPTDLDNLIGLCPRCHHLVHAGRLAVRPDGVGGFVVEYALGARIGRSIEDSVRANATRVRRHLRRLSRPDRDHPDPGSITLSLPERRFATLLYKPTPHRRT